MAAPTARDARQFDRMPPEIDADGSKLVYLFLDVRGTSTVSELAESLGMTKLSLYSILDTLSEKGLVESEGEAYETAA